MNSILDQQLEDKIAKDELDLIIDDINNYRIERSPKVYRHRAQSIHYLAVVRTAIHREDDGSFSVLVHPKSKFPGHHIEFRKPFIPIQ